VRGTETSPSAEFTRGVRVAVVAASLFTVAVVALQYSMAAGLPFFSEDYTQITLAATHTSFRDALSLDLVPLRPLHHLFTYWEHKFAHGVPAVARIPGFGMHLGSCFLVYVLARKLGVGALGAAVAMVLYVTFPNGKSLVWTAAIGWPGRQFFLLASLVAFLHNVRKPSLLAALGCVACFIAALGFHQGAFLLPVFAAALGLCVAEPDSRWSLPALARRLRDPLLLGLILLVGAYLVYLVLLRENRHTEVRDLAALPANLVKSSLSLFPEWYRQFVVQGLRGSGASFAAAASAFLLVPALLSALLWKGTPLLRCLTLLVAVELALPAVTTGFVHRYAYFASALVACGLGHAVAASAARRRAFAAALVVLLASQWAYDSHRDLRDYQEAGRVTNRLLQQAATAYADCTPEQSLVVVNIPSFDVQLGLRASSETAGPGAGHQRPIALRPRSREALAHEHPILQFHQRRCATGADDRVRGRFAGSHPARAGVRLAPGALPRAIDTTPGQRQAPVSARRRRSQRAQCWL